MIYTVTFNPSLDYGIYLEQVIPGEVNRAQYDTVYPGGKGINVSIILSHLGIENTALGFVAGFTGHALLELLNDSDVNTDFFSLPTGRTRINVKVNDKYQEQETELNAPGPEISSSSLEQLLNKMDATLQAGDIVVLAGSIPPTLPQTIYEEILSRYREKAIEFVVDATGDLLRRVLVHQPFLIKPNLDELGALFDAKLQGFEQAGEYAKKLQALGARNVLVSMGGEGALLLDEQGVITCDSAASGTVVSTVGSGDSMVAGFLAGWQRTNNYQKAFALGQACGSATAFSEWLAKKEDICSLLSAPEDYKF